MLYIHLYINMLKRSVVPFIGAVIYFPCDAESRLVAGNKKFYL